MTTRREVLKTITGLATAAGMGAISGSGAIADSGIDYTSTGATLINHPPVKEGYYFPAEWQHHERTLMQFLPEQNWVGYPIRPVRKEWAGVANAVSEFEPVTMVVEPDARARSQAKEMLSTQIELIEYPMNDGWARDTGPIILVNGTKERRVAGFGFNGWGEKFWPYRDDSLLKGHLAKYFNMPLHPHDLIIEGGGVHVDGEGTLLTTEQCLLHKNRNPGWTKAGIEAALKDYLGIKKVIWLPKGLVPDPITDGHIDGMAAFAAPGVVLLHTTTESSDPNYQITEAARKILQETPDAKGRKIEIIELPLTSWDVLHMNFYICNGGIIVPVANKSGEDDRPLGILREAFPKHKIVPVTGREMAGGGGGVHCITQQMPAV